MRKKEVIYLLVNIPVTYLLFVLLGWLFYLFCNGNPSYLIPFPILLSFFFILNLLFLVGVLKYFKKYNSRILLITVIEITLLYILLWFLLK
jgi:hypothetical protein